MPSEELPQSSVPIARSEELPDNLPAEIERQRRASARLLDDFSSSLREGGGRARVSINRAAHYLQEHYPRGAVSGMGRYIFDHPTASLVTAVLAGYMAGRMLRR